MHRQTGIRLFALTILVVVYPPFASGSGVVGVVQESQKIVGSEPGSGDQFGFAVAIGDSAIVVGTRLSDSAYIFERDAPGSDTWVEVARVRPSDGMTNIEFGQSVAVSGETVVVGAPAAQHTCLPGPMICSSGAAYIYERDQGEASQWGAVKRIVASDPGDGARFGISVALDEDTIAVGSDGDDFAGSNTGSTYIFERSIVGTLWGESRKVIASDAAAGAHFGLAVSLDVDTLLVGANRAGVAGTAYVFGRNRDGAEKWGQAEKLNGSDAESGDEFGESVAVSGDFALVSSPRDDDGCNGSDCNTGAVFVFERNFNGPENWGEVVKLVASEPSFEARFGTSLAKSGAAMIVGSPFDNDGGQRTGAAHLFMLQTSEPSSWSEVTKLKASDGEPDDEFGISASLSGGIAIVGAHFNVDNTQGVCCSSGASYIYDLQSELGLIFADGFESGDTSAWLSMR